MIQWMFCKDLYGSYNKISYPNDNDFPKQLRLIYYKALAPAILIHQMRYPQYDILSHIVWLVVFTSTTFDKKQMLKWLRQINLCDSSFVYITCSVPLLAEEYTLKFSNGVRFKMVKFARNLLRHSCHVVPRMKSVYTQQHISSGYIGLHIPVPCFSR